MLARRHHKSKPVLHTKIHFLRGTMMYIQGGRAAIPCQAMATIKPQHKHV